MIPNQASYHTNSNAKKSTIFKERRDRSGDVLHFTYVDPKIIIHDQLNQFPLLCRHNNLTQVL